MKPSDFQKTVQCRFESCLKKVVRSVVKDYYKELNRRKNKEISFSELPDVLVDKMAVWDDYETDYTIFSVCGIDIRVLDDELAEALKKLPERKRNTLLMYYFLEMTESEIANLQKITQSGVFRNRHHAFDTILLCFSFKGSYRLYVLCGLFSYPKKFKKFFKRGH